VEVGEDAALELVVSLHRLLRSLGRTSRDRTLQPTQLITLVRLTEQGPSRIGMIAESVPCSQPTATAAVSGLEAAGLVRREPDLTDGRAQRIAVTEAGVRALKDMAHSEAEALAARLASLPAEDARSVLAVGHLLRRLADCAPGRPAE